MLKKSLFFNGIKDGFPIFLGYLAVAFTFGIAASKIGVFASILMSATNLTSAGQFAGLDIIEDSLPYFAMALSQLIINLRYCLMSSSLSQKFDSDMPSIHRYLIAFGVTDEIFGVCSQYKGKLRPSYCYGIIFVSFSGWVGGTLLGAVSGTVLPKSVLSALGIALYGMFIAIIMPSAKKERSIALIIFSSMILSALFSYAPILKTVSSSFRIIILTVLISAIAAVLKPVKESGDKAK
ncbi:MAG: AzlC family ABC transporter permease [Clostridia bacterium]|nr:AzlC family ABC transporter permease [Clostridia bacterium]